MVCTSRRYSLRFHAGACTWLQLRPQLQLLCTGDYRYSIGKERAPQMGGVPRLCLACCSFTGTWALGSLRHKDWAGRCSIPDSKSDHSRRPPPFGDGHCSQLLPGLHQCLQSRRLLQPCIVPLSKLQPLPAGFPELI